MPIACAACDWPRRTTEAGPRLCPGFPRKVRGADFSYTEFHEPFTPPVRPVTRAAPANAGADNKVGKAGRRLAFGVAGGFVLLLGMLLAVVWVGLAHIARLNAELEALVEVNNAKVALAGRMKSALRERAIIMHSISVMTNPFDQDEEFVRFNELGGDFTSARTELEFLADSEVESAIMGRMRTLTIKTQPVVVEAVNLALKQRHAEARRLIEREIIPAQKKLAHEIDALVALQQQDARTVVVETRSVARAAQRLMVGLGLAAGLLGAGIAVVVIRRTTGQARQLERQALYDNLTDLPNRRLFADELGDTLADALRAPRTFAVLALDLDRFKEVNDTLGHEVGDQVLCEVARRVRSCVRASDTVARMGGDELAVLLPVLPEEAFAETLGQRLRERLTRPLELAGGRVEIGCSIGIALFPRHGDSAALLQRCADAAMYHAKRQRTGVAVYRPEFDTEAAAV